MRQVSFSARYRTAMTQSGGRGPIETGVLGRLADHECRHGRLPSDRTPVCGCWPQAVFALPRPSALPSADRRAA